MFASPFHPRRTSYLSVIRAVPKENQDVTRSSDEVADCGIQSSAIFRCKLFANLEFPNEIPPPQAARETPPATQLS
jgi:hypothetical protein